MQNTLLSLFIMQRCTGEAEGEANYIYILGLLADGFVQSDLQILSHCYTDGSGCHARCNCSSGAIWGLVSCSRTHAVRGDPEFEPATFWLLDDPLYLLSYSRKNVEWENLKNEKPFSPVVRMSQ